jgi:hypothetical protein
LRQRIGENIDVQDELRQLEERRQVYLSTAQDPSRTLVQREEALGALELTEAKIAILPGEVHSSKEIDDLLLTLERSGIDIYEDVSSAKGAGAALQAAEALEAEVKEEGTLGDEAELDRSPARTAHATQ